MRRRLFVLAASVALAAACRSKRNSDTAGQPTPTASSTRTPAQTENLRLLLELKDRIDRRIEGDGYDSLSVPEKTIHCVWWLEAEVNNGGFDQYFFNDAGDHAADTPVALERIGAPRAAAIVRQAIAIFPAPGPSPHRFSRQAQLERLPSSRRDEFEHLDKAFYAYPEDLEALLATFARAHASALRR
jgi:hypothetical protein